MFEAELMLRRALKARFSEAAVMGRDSARPISSRRRLLQQEGCWLEATVSRIPSRNPPSAAPNLLAAVGRRLTRVAVRSATLSLSASSPNACDDCRSCSFSIRSRINSSS